MISDEQILARVSERFGYVPLGLKYRGAGYVEVYRPGVKHFDGSQRLTPRDADIERYHLGSDLGFWDLGESRIRESWHNGIYVDGPFVLNAFPTGQEGDAAFEWVVGWSPDGGDAVQYFADDIETSGYAATQEEAERMALAVMRKIAGVKEGKVTPVVESSNDSGLQFKQGQRTGKWYWRYNFPEDGYSTDWTGPFDSLQLASDDGWAWAGANVVESKFRSPRKGVVEGYGPVIRIDLTGWSDAFWNRDEDFDGPVDVDREYGLYSSIQDKIEKALSKEAVLPDDRVQPNQWGQVPEGPIFGWLAKTASALTDSILDDMRVRVPRGPYNLVYYIRLVPRATGGYDIEGVELSESKFRSPKTGRFAKGSYSPNLEEPAPQIANLGVVQAPRLQESLPSDVAVDLIQVARNWERDLVVYPNEDGSVTAIEPLTGSVVYSSGTNSRRVYGAPAVAKVSAVGGAVLWLGESRLQESNPRASTLNAIERALSGESFVQSYLGNGVTLSIEQLLPGKYDSRFRVSLTHEDNERDTPLGSPFTVDSADLQDTGYMWATIANIVGETSGMCLESFESRVSRRLKESVPTFKGTPDPEGELARAFAQKWADEQGIRLKVFIDPALGTWNIGSPDKWRDEEGFIVSPGQF